jgi:hypothetical protein
MRVSEINFMKKKSTLKPSDSDKPSFLKKLKIKAKKATLYSFIYGVVVPLSIAGGFETYLRCTRPDIGDLINYRNIPHISRIFGNDSDTIRTYPHPDTREEHLMIHNNFALRQHRNFSIDKPENTIRVGLLGDSFTDNIRMPGVCSLSEPLDYLLNTFKIDEGINYEVLNFGVNGYGTDQTYLLYLEEGIEQGLDQAIYVYCYNDLPEIILNKLIEIDESGNIIHNPSKMRDSLNQNLLRKLYSYHFVKSLSSENKYRYSNLLKSDFADWTENKRDERYTKFWENGGLNNFSQEETAVHIFTRLVNEIRSDVEGRGGEFYATLVPYGTEDHNEKVERILQTENIAVINLESFFDGINNPYYKFVNDGHWNEKGTALAAVSLFKRLSQNENLGIREATDKEITSALSDFYSTFTVCGVNDYADGTLPTTQFSEALRERYIPLELNLEQNQSNN